MRKEEERAREKEGGREGWVDGCIGPSEGVIGVVQPYVYIYSTYIYIYTYICRGPFTGLLRFC